MMYILPLLLQLSQYKNVFYTIMAVLYNVQQNLIPVSSVAESIFALFFYSILYQLGLQDVFVYYAGGDPFRDMRSYLDVGWSIGELSRIYLRYFPLSMVLVTHALYSGSTSGQQYVI